MKRFIKTTLIAGGIYTLAYGGHAEHGTPSRAYAIALAFVAIIVSVLVERAITLTKEINA